MSFKLKIYSDGSYLRNIKNIRPILMPFWGHSEATSGPTAGRFDQWIAEGKNIFEMVSLEEADIAVYPMDPTIDRAGFERFQKATGSKKMIAFFNSDSDETLSYRDNVYIFRTSFYKSKQRKTEFAVPGWSEDWGVQEPNQWRDKPVVGFCGQIVGLSSRRVRVMSLLALEKNTGIKTNFIKKAAFWGGWINGGKKLSKGNQLRSEFIGNIRESDYVVCARGGGNFSYRIYETMMSGRIPILIDTDCVLPYDFMIRWGNEFPIIKEHNLASLGTKVLDFHYSIRDNFEAHQLRIRSLWEKWISPVGFFENIYKHWEI